MYTHIRTQIFRTKNCTQTQMPGDGIILSPHKRDVLIDIFLLAYFMKCMDNHLLSLTLFSTKPKNMRHPMRNELTNNGLLA